MHLAKIITSWVTKVNKDREKIMKLLPLANFGKCALFYYSNFTKSISVVFDRKLHTCGHNSYFFHSVLDMVEFVGHTIKYGRKSTLSIFFCYCAFFSAKLSQTISCCFSNLSCI